MKGHFQTGCYCSHWRVPVMTSHCQPCFPQIALHSLGSIPDLSPVDKELTFGQKLGGLIGWPCLALAKCSFLLSFPSSLFLFVARNVFAWQGCANKWFLEFGSEVRVLTETWSAPGSLTASRPEAELNTPGAPQPGLDARGRSGAGWEGTQREWQLDLNLLVICSQGPPSCPDLNQIHLGEDTAF